MTLLSRTESTVPRTERGADQMALNVGCKKCIQKDSDNNERKLLDRGTEAWCSIMVDLRQLLGMFLLTV